MKSPRETVAAAAGAGLGALSRAFGRGSGSVIGGHAILALEPRALARFSAGRLSVLVSGTNGKSTTTSLLTSALEAVLGEDVATNVDGANLPTGLAVALARARRGAPVVLEVDEAWLARVALEVRPDVLVLLNLSRDQLDRNNEVRQLAERWRRAASELPGPAVVVANADDPLVAWAAMAASRTVWVGAGLSWRADAVGCPSCGNQISFADEGADREGWQCRSCELARPEPAFSLELCQGGLWCAVAGPSRQPIDLRLPGRANAANALMALAAVDALVNAGLGGSGLALNCEDLSRRALKAMATVEQVAGRYSVVERAGTTARLLLAKNPAGWAEVFEMLAPPPAPVVVAVNARTADGRDPSWIWDVPFERLAGRRVVASGERCLDVAVRLHYADVQHLCEPDLLAALSKAGPGKVDAVANYTAFHQLLAASRHQPRPKGANRWLEAEPVVPLGEGGAGVNGPEARPLGEARRASLRRLEADVTIALVYPELLGTYGDAGNATVLAQRLRWRGARAEVLLVSANEAVPDGCEIYVLGGGEDLPQILAAQRLRQSRALHRAVGKGAVVLAVCAGLQVLGESFPAPGGGGSAPGNPSRRGRSASGASNIGGASRSDGRVEGLGLLPCVTYRSDGPRAIGEVLVSASGRWSGLGLLTGFENHASVTELLPGAEPAGEVLAGIGNKDGVWEGVVCGRIWGTYLHGPVLARNPRLADLLLSWVVGPLSPLEDCEEHSLHAQRCSRGPYERRAEGATLRWPWGRPAIGRLSNGRLPG